MYYDRVGVLFHEYISVVIDQDYMDDKHSCDYDLRHHESRVYFDFSRGLWASDLMGKTKLYPQNLEQGR